MVDNRSIGSLGGGAFNFKSGDISGTAAKLSDDKMGQGSEYFGQGEGEEEQSQNNEHFVDRSAQLRATLNSLAMMNVASVLTSKKRSDFLNEKKEEQNEKERENKKEKSELDEEFLNDFDDDILDEEDKEYY